MRYIHDENGYKAIFDEKSGYTIRYESPNNGLAWKKSGPELLDVSITNYCEKGCDFCYRESGVDGDFMSLDLFDEIMKQAQKAKVFQVALGGGNPNQHPQFIEFLKTAKEYGIVPTYTTNGQGMNKDIYRASSMYCGAIAVSWYEPYDEAIEVINNCWEYKITTNIHFVLDEDKISEARKLLNHEILNKVNALIFLNYKPLGIKKRNVLKRSRDIDEFFQEAFKTKRCKIGFDSCMISHLAQNRDRFIGESVDYCEAGRYSAFISEHGKMYPCSFMCGDKKKGSSIIESSLKDIWTNEEFVRIRIALNTKKGKCERCSEYSICHGGCPIFDINC